MKFFIQIFLDGFEAIIVGLLTLAVVLQLQTDGVAHLDVLADQSQWQLQDLHVVGNQSDIVLPDTADVVRFLVERSPHCSFPLVRWLTRHRLGTLRTGEK